MTNLQMGAGAIGKPKKQSRKKPNILKRQEALDRLRMMFPHIKRNIQQAIQIKATLEAGNRIVIASIDKEFMGAEAYNVIKTSLAFDLALHVARLFDAKPVLKRQKVSGKRNYGPRHPNVRDEASIPLLLRLLGQKRCRQALVDAAYHWHPDHDDWSKRLYAQDCERAIDEAVKIYSRVSSGKDERAALKYLKNMRDTIIAHSSINPATPSVTYNQLFHLVGVAQKIVEPLNVAIEGHSIYLSDIEKCFDDAATELWNRALIQGNTQVEHPHRCNT